MAKHFFSGHAVRVRRVDIYSTFSAQLLLHLEEDLIGHAEAALNIFNHAIHDTERVVGENVTWVFFPPF